MRNASIRYQFIGTGYIATALASFNRISYQNSVFLRTVSKFGNKVDIGKEGIPFVPKLLIYQYIKAHDCHPSGDHDHPKGDNHVLCTSIFVLRTRSRLILCAGKKSSMRLFTCA